MWACAHWSEPQDRRRTHLTGAYEEKTMITLPDRFELLSDAWLDEAKKFLERECRNRKERLAGSPFSVSERFTDAPPHLKLTDNAGAWNLRYDGENVSVS